MVVLLLGVNFDTGLGIGLHLGWGVRRESACRSMRTCDAMSGKRKRGVLVVCFRTSFSGLDGSAVQEIVHKNSPSCVLPSYRN